MIISIISCPLNTRCADPAPAASPAQIKEDLYFVQCDMRHQASSAMCFVSGESKRRVEHMTIEIRRFRNAFIECIWKQWKDAESILLSATNLGNLV